MRVRLLLLLFAAAALGSCGDSSTPSTSPATTSSAETHLRAIGQDIHQAATAVATQAEPALHEAATEARAAIHTAASRVSEETATRPATSPAPR